MTDEITRGYNYVKPNWQDVLIGLFQSAFAALKNYSKDQETIKYEIAALDAALSANIRRNQAWLDRWNQAHTTPDGKQRRVDLELRRVEIGLYVELAMLDGMVWPRMEAEDEEATREAEERIKERLRVRA